MPTAAEFEAQLHQMLDQAQRVGKATLSVTGKYLHEKVGGYPEPANRMAVCCLIMWKNRLDGDRVVATPDSGAGATLEIEYHTDPSACQKRRSLPVPT